MAKSTRQKIPMDASTPAHPLKKTEMNSELTPIEIVQPGAGMEKKIKTIDLVIEAIKAVGLPRKGASLQAIKKWIEANKENQLRSSPVWLKKAVLQGIESGILVRPNHCRAAHGATGSFALAPIKAVPVKSKNKVHSSPSKQLPKKANKEPKPAAQPKGKTAKADKRELSNSFSEADTRKKADKQLEVKRRQRSNTADAIEQKDQIKSKKPLKAKSENAPKPKKNSGKESNKPKAPIKGIDEPNVKKGKDKPNAAGTSKKDLAKETDTKDAGKRKQKAPRNKKQLDSKMAMETIRKDSSDTEIDVKHKQLKSLKSYSSDTELEISRQIEEKAQKATKNRYKIVPKRGKKGGETFEKDSF